MSNGCGCETGLLKYLKPPHAKMFYAACVKHDDAYSWGGSSKDRLRADRQLFFDMMKIARRKSENPFTVAYFMLVGIVYYVSVRAFGWMYFNKKNGL